MPQRNEVDTSRRNGRIMAALLLALAVVIAIGAANITFAFSSDPLGPRALPYILALILGLCAVWYFLQPGDAEPWPDRAMLGRAALLIGVTAAACGAMNVIGFPFAAVIMSTVAAYCFGASARTALLIAIAQAAFWSILFIYGLGTYLPTGTLFMRG